MSLTDWNAFTELGSNLSIAAGRGEGLEGFCKIEARPHLDKKAVLSQDLRIMD